jgi:hypothetical protein
MTKLSNKNLITIIILLIIIVIMSLLAYFYFKNKNTPITVTDDYSTSSLHINMNNWSYDSTNNVYYQIGVQYVGKPVSTEYETLGIYVPGEYLTCSNSGSSYSCTVNEKGTLGNYNSSNAPMVMPVNTPGYMAQAAPTSYNYNTISEYVKAGLIYVYAGCRGKANGTNYAGNAPWGVTDLKAAVRYIRYNADKLPGNTERIFTFGHSGGGAQSAIMGATGDSELYTKYLESLEAVMKDDNGNAISDAIMGAMCWCPITNLDYADEAYEWNMGQFMTTGTRADSTWTAALSKDLATSFAEYLNQLQLKDGNNNLTLTESNDGIYLSGSYYDYLLSIIEASLNNFLKDTQFPYTPNNTTMAGMGTGLGGRQGMNQSTSSTTYNTVTDYINSLNSDETWVVYDAKINTAKITSVGAFVKHLKNATKDVGAFDSLSRSQAENDVFGTNTTDALHFDETMANLLKNNANTYAKYSDYKSYIDDYANDLLKTDALGNDSLYRQNMYNPMYYLSSYYAGYNTSKVAKYWRIRTGINQGDTALTTETNLMLALKMNSNVKDVDFATIWGLGHTMAEETGSASTNFINWINDSLKG